VHYCITARYTLARSSWSFGYGEISKDRETFATEKPMHFNCKHRYVIEINDYYVIEIKEDISRSVAEGSQW